MQKTPVSLTHGGDWAGYAAEYGALPLDFSANISPLGVPAGVKTAIARAAGTADRYPDPLCRALCGAITAAEGLPDGCCLCGNGAADLIFRVAAARRPRKALVVSPTFAEYESALHTVGCTVERYRLKENFRLDEDFLTAIVPGVELVFLCEPNNPTGLTTPRALLLQILSRCRAVGALLVADECFHDFLDAPAAHSLESELSDFDNLLILRAFTKLYAMAGVRLGYCLCGDAGLLAALRAAGQPWAVSSLAQAAGLAALRETAYVDRVRALLALERPRLAAALEGLGLRVVPGEANYLLFQCQTPLLPPLRQRGILLRSCANYENLDGSWYRAAVRTRAENDTLIAALGEVLG